MILSTSNYITVCYIFMTAESIFIYSVKVCEMLVSNGASKTKLCSYENTLLAVFTIPGLIFILQLIKAPTLEVVPRPAI